jgi:uncharacterized membrane protein
MRVPALTCVLIAALATGSAARAGAPNHEPAGLGGLAVKTAVFEAFSSTLETGLFVAFYGGGAISTGGVLAVNVVTSSAIYAAHEYAWEGVTPPDTARDDPRLVLGKAATYRVLSIARSFAAGYLLGGAQAATSAAFAVTVAVADSAVYAATELGFAWARSEPPPAP